MVSGGPRIADETTSWPAWVPRETFGPAHGGVGRPAPNRNRDVFSSAGLSPGWAPATLRAARGRPRGPRRRAIARAGRLRHATVTRSNHAIPGQPDVEVGHGRGSSLEMVRGRRKRGRIDVAAILGARFECEVSSG